MFSLHKLGAVDFPSPRSFTVCSRLWLCGNILDKGGHLKRGTVPCTEPSVKPLKPGEAPGKPPVTSPLQGSESGVEQRWALLIREPSRPSEPPPSLFTLLTSPPAPGLRHSHKRLLTQSDSEATKSRLLAEAETQRLAPTSAREVRLGPQRHANVFPAPTCCMESCRTAPAASRAQRLARHQHLCAGTRIPEVFCYIFLPTLRPRTCPSPALISTKHKHPACQVLGLGV